MFQFNVKDEWNNKTIMHIEPSWQIIPKGHNNLKYVNYESFKKRY